MNVDTEHRNPARVDAPNGLTVPEVAERLGLSERQVWNLLRGPDPVLTSFTWECRRLVDPREVARVKAERGSGGGAGTGSGGGSSSGSGSTNTGSGAGTGPGREAA